jgi:hypothetical protein
MRSRIGASTFSTTVSEEKSAPSWNITPQRFSRRRRSAGGAVSTSVPKTRIEPAAGRLRPQIVRRSTDLPVPEPPTMPSTSPR